jgi:hypothetical protein
VPAARNPFADVEESELRDPRAQVRHHHSDPNQPIAREGAERDPAAVDEALQRVPLGLDGMVAVAVGGLDCPSPAPGCLAQVVLRCLRRAPLTFVYPLVRSGIIPVSGSDRSAVRAGGTTPCLPKEFHER